MKHILLFIISIMTMTVSMAQTTTVTNATHVDLYDQPSCLAIILPKLESFFKQYLK